MENFKRFSVQILGTVDAKSTEELLSQINSALGSIPKFNIKAVSHDKWTDGFTGKDRQFDVDGNEIVVQPTTIPQIPLENTTRPAEPELQVTIS